MTCSIERRIFLLLVAAHHMVFRAVGIPCPVIAVHIVLPIVHTIINRGVQMVWIRGERFGFIFPFISTINSSSKIFLNYFQSHGLAHSIGCFFVYNQSNGGSRVPFFIKPTSAIVKEIEWKSGELDAHRVGGVPHEFA